MVTSSDKNCIIKSQISGHAEGGQGRDSSRVGPNAKGGTDMEIEDKRRSNSWWLWRRIWRGGHFLIGKHSREEWELRLPLNGLAGATYNSHLQLTHTYDWLFDSHLCTQTQHMCYNTISRTSKEFLNLKVQRNAARWLSYIRTGWLRVKVGI